MPRMKNNLEELKQGTEQVVEDAKAEAAKVVEEVKPTVEKAVKATRKTAAKASEKVKKTAAKAVGAEVAPVVYVQYQGEEEKIEDLVAAAKASFAAEHARTKVTDLKLYIKPEERAAYYVVNEKFAGRVDF